MVLINVTSLYGKTSAMDTVDGSSTGIAMCQIAFLLRDAESLLMATSRHPVARNRSLLYPQNRTFRDPCWTSVRDPKPTLALPRNVEHCSLTTLREKLVKIGAKVVRHGRYVTFQLAEVAVSRDLFRNILSLIDDLRPRPAPA